MKYKLLAIFFITALLASFMPSIAFAADPPKSKYKVGDKVVFGTGLVGTLQSIDAKTGKGTFKSTIDAPKYLNDLKTTVKTDWIASDGRYITGDNLFKATVNGSKTTVSYEGKSITWEPDLTVANEILKPTIPFTINDPLNSNYGKNTVAWVYEGGITRYLRQIEGVLMDYYVIDRAPAGDIVIRDHADKKNGYNYDTAAYAFDADNKPIKVTIEDGVKAVLLADLKDAKYPITIDPTNNYITSASDGSTWGSNAVYNTVQSQASASNGALSSDLYLYLGQYAPTGYNIFRSYVYFDTTSMPDAATITSATLSLYGEADHSETNFDITIESGMSTYPHDPLQASDYDKTLYTDGGGNLTTVGFSVVGYNAITLSATGRGWVNKTGYTKFCIRSSRDISATAPTGIETLDFFSYEKGAGYRPKLDITYTAAIPTVTTAATDNITGTTATLHGEITATGGENADLWGFVWDTSSHGDPGNVAPPATYSDNYTYTGSQGLGTFLRNVTGLTKCDTYYARSFSHNPGGYGYGNEVTFTMLDDPTITANTPTSITTSTARLQAYLNASGGATCTTRWGYGLVNQGNNIAAYTTVTAYAGAWETGDSPYLDITTLAAGTVYYFNVEANNGTYTDTGTVVAFTTEALVGSVSNVTAIPTDTTVTLSWIKGTGASNTKIRFAANACPTDNVTGTETYAGTASTYIHTGLTPGIDYCYWLKGYDAVSGWSTTAVTIHCTTTAGATTNLPGASTGFSPGFLDDPDSTTLEAKFPGNPVNQAISDSVGMPINYLYFIGSMLAMIVCCFVAFRISREPIAPAIVCALFMAVGGWQGIIPGFLAWGLGISAIGLIVLKSRSVI